MKTATTILCIFMIHALVLPATGALLNGIPSAVGPRSISQDGPPGHTHPSPNSDLTDDDDGQIPVPVVLLAPEPVPSEPQVAQEHGSVAIFHSIPVLRL